MDAEKNVVEAARRVIDWAGRGWRPTVFDPLREAIAAYDAAPAPSEDRVREAAGRCVRALLMDSRCTEGDRLAIKKRGSDGNEHDLGAWSHDAALNVIAEALRPYVTPAPRPTPGEVSVPVAVVREAASILSDLYMVRGDERVAKAHNALSKLLPPIDWPAEARKAAMMLWASGEFSANDSLSNAETLIAEMKRREAFGGQP